MASRGQPKLRRLPSAVKFGVPLVLFCVAGYVGLSTFVSGKVEMQDSRYKSKSVRAFELEQEHKRVMESLDLKNFEIKPIPRPKQQEE